LGARKSTSLKLKLKLKITIGHIYVRSTGDAA